MTILAILSKWLISLKLLHGFGDNAKCDTGLSAVEELLGVVCYIRHLPGLNCLAMLMLPKETKECGTKNADFLSVCCMHFHLY